jgi:hypothetical protein
MNPGEKGRHTVLGNAIYELTKQEDVKKILDIGTSNGGGTTICIRDGIVDSQKENYIVYSLECNKERWQGALMNFPPLQNFYLLHGTITSCEDLEPLLETLADLWDGPDKQIPLVWLKQDIEAIKTSPNILSKMPARIDLLVIDGGEFSGWIEFQKLYKRSKYIAMDDVNSFKNKESRKFVLDHMDEFKVLLDDVNNNCFVCENILL